MIRVSGVPVDAPPTRGDAMSDDDGDSELVWRDGYGWVERSRVVTEILTADDEPERASA